MKFYMCKKHTLLQKKLQAGDKVRIISKERVSKIKASGYDFMFGFNNEMIGYCGKEFVITYKEAIKGYKYEDGTYPLAFYLKDAGGFTYSVEMFEVQLSSTTLENE